MKKAINTTTGRVESASSYSKDARPKYEYECPVEECAKTVTWACGATSLKSSPHFRHLPGEGKGCPGNDEIDIETVPGTIRGDVPTAENRGAEIHTDFPDYLTEQPAEKLITDSPDADPLTGPRGKHHSTDLTQSPGNIRRVNLRRHLINLARDPDAYRGETIRIKEPGFDTRHESGEDVFIRCADVSLEHVGQRIYVYGPIYNIKSFRLKNEAYDGYYLNSAPYRPDAPDTFSFCFTDQQAIKHFDEFSVEPDRRTPGLLGIAYGPITTKDDKTTPKMVITDQRRLAFLHAPKDTRRAALKPPRSTPARQK